MNRIAAGTIALVLGVLLAGCSTQRFANQCRLAGDDGFVWYRWCKSVIPGEYIVSLGEKHDVNVINELFGQFGIKSIKELREASPSCIRGCTELVKPLPMFLVTITNDPGPQKMFEIGYDYGQLFGRAWVYVTPNYSTQ
jgi:hypothetical protein